MTSHTKFEGYLKKKFDEENGAEKYPEEYFSAWVKTLELGRLCMYAEEWNRYEIMKKHEA